MVNASVPKIFNNEQALFSLYKEDKATFFFDFKDLEEYYWWCEVSRSSISTGLFGKVHDLKGRVSDMVEKEGWSKEPV